MSINRVTISKDDLDIIKRGCRQIVGGFSNIPLCVERIEKIMEYQRATSLIFVLDSIEFKESAS